MKEKQEQKLTRGGPPLKQVDNESQMVYNVIPKQFDPLDNTFDDDAQNCTRMSITNN